MASYQSSPNLPVSPHVSNIDPQLYGQIIGERQEQYNLGVQKVQNFVDSIAGIEAVRDIDKQYLQDSVNGLQTDIGKLAGEDFSRANVVNQASGLASRIAKDPTIQNAVLSTQQYKKAIQAAKEAEAKGESSPSNKWLLNKQVESWLDNPDIDASFNGSYVPYRNYRKKAVEAIKGLNPDSTIREDQIMIDENGKPTISGALMTTELSGISPERVSQALNSYLDEGDFQQMGIDAQYRFRDYGDGEIKGMIAKKTASELERVQAQIDIYESQKSTMSNGATSIQLGEAIKQLEKRAEDLVAKGETQLTEITNGNRDSVLGSIFADEFISNFSSAFSSEKKSETQKKDPLFEAQQSKDEFAFKIQQWGEEKALKERELTGGTGGGIGTGGGLSVPFTADTAPDMSISSAKNMAVTQEKLAKDKKTELLVKTGEGEEWYQQQVALYNTGKTTDPVVKAYIEEIETAKSKAISTAAAVQKIESEANELFKMKDLKIPEGSKPVTIETTSGNVTFTPEELVMYAHKMKTLEEGMARQPISQMAIGARNAAVGVRDFFTGATTPKEGTNFEEEYLQTEFTPKEKLLIAAETASKNGVNNLNKYQGDNYKAINKAPGREVTSALLRYKLDVTAASAQKVKEKDDWVREKVRTSFGVKEPKSFPLSGTDKARGYIQNTVAQLISQGEQMNESLGPNVDMENLKKLNLENTTQYSIVVAPASSVSEGKYTIAVQGKSGETEYIPLTTEQKFSLYQTQFESPSAGFDPIADKIALTGNGSTNFGGTFKLKDAMVAPNFSKKDFPGIRNFSVSGDFQEKDGRYSLVMYVYDPITKEPRRIVYAPQSGLMDKGEAAASIQAMNDTEVYKLLYGKVPTPEQMAEITQINQKPD